MSGTVFDSFLLYMEADMKYKCLIFPVFTLRSGNAFAGLIGFKSADAARRSVEIGYWLREEQQGKVMA